jgi:hypothetical protein
VPLVQLRLARRRLLQQESAVASSAIDLVASTEFFPSAQLQEETADILRTEST